MLPTPWYETLGFEVREVWEVWEGVLVKGRGLKVLSRRTLAVPYKCPVHAHAAVLGMSSALAEGFLIHASGRITFTLTFQLLLSLRLTSLLSLMFVLLLLPSVVDTRPLCPCSGPHVLLCAEPWPQKLLMWRPALLLLTLPLPSLLMFSLCCSHCPCSKCSC